MSYAEKLRDPRWQKKRLRVMERDGFKCRDCGAGDKTLTVHHCHYEKGGPWQTNQEFLLTVCQDCHKVRQQIEDSIRFGFGRLFSMLSRKQLIHLTEFSSRLLSMFGKESQIEREGP